MKHVARTIAAAMGLILGGATTLGQTASDSSVFLRPASVNEMPRVGFLAGSFATQTVIPPLPSLPQGATGKGTSVIAWALDSMFLMIEQESFNSLLGHYKGHGMLGFDSQTRQYELFMFNNFGDRLSYRGSFIGDTLVLQTRVPAPQGAFDQKLLWYKERGAVKLKVLNDLGKGFLPALEETATPVLQSTK